MRKKRGRHWVLVVLLLGNVVINESLPIFLDGAIGGGIAAVVISTTAIVIFGYVLAPLGVGLAEQTTCLLFRREVIPQAVSVRYGLAIGARCAPFVLCLMYLFAPIAYPTAKLLDYFHRTGEEPLRDDEISILNGVLELNTKNVETIMTPSSSLSLASGYSRFPIHEPGNPLSFQGLLLIKKLLVYDPARALPVSDFKLSILPEAHPSINCFQALDYFQTGRAHLLLISRTPGTAGGGIGVITLEDIIEEIISEEIVDETDRYEDNQSKKRAKRMTTATIMRGIVEREGRERSLTRVTSSDRIPLLRETPLLPSTPLSETNYPNPRYGAILSPSPKI
ncbi:uncharacterized protein EDB93DRAFT_1256561 [Suillus bovinus]|uniref:uncharacterized protein n=1 Tax=Suillus bovinus TaxID=48563 RepID=UPI001B8697BF|nr:uncharacterized protein EDB93DRAFT_1256561 [Suillus bovinus]KAG2128770.1 hypothetical protein EDB93DRAFT_1256561 [Suillus bovinus]